MPVELSGSGLPYLQALRIIVLIRIRLYTMYKFQYIVVDEEVPTGSSSAGVLKKGLLLSLFFGHIS